MAAQLAMTTLFYVLLRPVDRTAAVLSLVFGLVGATIKTVARAFYYAPLLLLGGAGYLTVFDVSQLQALSLLFVKINNQIANMALVFLGISTFFLGYLIVKSTFLPRLLGVVSIVSGLGWLVYLYPALGSALFYYLIVLAMLGVLLTSGWLLVRGVDEQRWPDHAPVAVADQRPGHADAPARRVDLDADRGLESGLWGAGAGAELNPLLFGEHLRVDQAHGTRVHGREQPLERGHEHWSLRRLFFSAVRAFHRFHGSVGVPQRQPPQPSREIEQRCEPPQQVTAHPGHVDREREIAGDQCITHRAADFHCDALLRLGRGRREMRGQDHTVERPQWCVRRERLDGEHIGRPPAEPPPPC